MTARPCTRDMTDPDPVRDLPDFAKRMAAARARAQYELGDAAWAAVILKAFMDPREDGRRLAGEAAEAS